MNTLKVYRKCENAVIPQAETKEAVGMDLTAISISKQFGEHTYLYDTGLCVIPPEGYYVAIYPRSSISKSGYILANSTGIIDPDYRETLKLALTKIDHTKPDLELPFKICQITLEKIHLFRIEEVDRIEENGRGGFGSTDRR